MDERKLSIGELWEKIHAGTKFTLEEILIMCDKSAESGEPFIITHNEIRYLVPQGEIERYFTEHPRPERPLSMKEENDRLRRELRAMEAKLSASQTAVKAADGGKIAAAEQAPDPGGHQVAIAEKVKDISPEKPEDLEL